MVHPIPSGATVTAKFGQRGRYWSMDQANDPLRAIRRGNNGQPGWGIHTGLDLYALPGTQIVAATPGAVVANDYDNSYGWRVIIRFDGEDWWYCHMRERSTLAVGAKVDASDRVGRVGATGNTSGAHLHLERRIAGGGWVRSHLRDPNAGLSWKPKPKSTRIASWNVYLIKRHPKLSVAYRTSKIAAYAKKWDLDVLAVQECPSKGDGKHLFPKLAAIGLVKRVGSHGRYLFFRAGTIVHEWKSWEIDGKRVTLACATVNGRRRVFVNCHPVSGSTKAAKAARTRWAEKLIPLVHRFADATNTPREDEIYMGDFNGSEFHAVARKHGIRLVRSFARIKSTLTRTYNAWGRKHTTPGGHFDYILTDESKKNAIAKAKTFFTPKASDHNPVFVEIKE